ncbi:hypothetical protein HGRIS_003969 [Hohenbuehelia grisea]|uniref:DUF6533 domain-containing protein n=1 Tax=Hohenbuehelia grisea TaxID=104357 RepID=A0ABR3JH57_9AGAR
MTAELDGASVTLNYNIVAQDCMALVALTVLLYDHALTLGDEIRYAWKKTLSPLNILFLIERYFAPPAFIICIVLPMLTPEHDLKLIFALFCTSYAEIRVIPVVLSDTSLSPRLTTVLMSHLVLHTRSYATSTMYTDTSIGSYGHRRPKSHSSIGRLWRFLTASKRDLVAFVSSISAGPGEIVFARGQVSTTIRS